MALNEALLKIMSKLYEPSTLVELKFGRYDLVFKTDDAGRPILLFLGKKNAAGRITGERYARRLLFDTSGHVIKDHWERKGKAT